MSQIEGAGAAGDPRRIQPQKPVPPKSADKPVKKHAADSIELSDEAKKLAGQGGSRAARIEAVRRMLEDGSLYTPEALRRAAENLLKSGELDGADEG